MGMDVFGGNPTTKKGKYFRNTMCHWAQLAEYVCAVAPDIAKRCKYWQYNDGDGLNARDTIRLADALQAELDQGRTAAYARVRASTPPNAADCPFDVENVQAFVAFLRGSGGFRIC